MGNSIYLEIKCCGFPLRTHSKLLKPPVHEQTNSYKVFILSVFDPCMCLNLFGFKLPMVYQTPFYYVCDAFYVSIFACLKSFIGTMFHTTSIYTITG